MKNQFDFFGIQTPIRRKIQQPFFDKKHLPTKSYSFKIIKTLWGKQEREFQLFGQELIHKYHKKFEVKDLHFFEYMITHKSWWDTVDFIAVHLVGEYFKLYPELKNKVIKKWIASNNMWLQRTAIIFQLKYKNNIDTNLLSFTINKLLNSKEFFINKAIGWMLREYSKTNPIWVVAFCNKTNLHSLSKREALRLL